jgi:streptolysin S family bacteriocin protoxin
MGLLLQFTLQESVHGQGGWACCCSKRCRDLSVGRGDHPEGGGEAIAAPLSGQVLLTHNMLSMAVKPAGSRT